MTDSTWTTVADAFIDGVDAQCKAAGLTDDQSAGVWDATLQAVYLLREKAAAGTAQGWGQQLLDAAKAAPASAVGGVLGAGAGLIGTALFGRRDADGRKHYLRNALLGAAGGAALPYAASAYNRHVQRRNNPAGLADYKPAYIPAYGSDVAVQRARDAWRKQVIPTSAPLSAGAPVMTPSEQHAARGVTVRQ